MRFNRVSVIGLGYIGLPTAAILAAKSVEVIGVDVNPGVVESITQRQLHIIEPGLDGLVLHAVDAGYLRATTTPEPADAFIIAVPTPFTADRLPDVTYVRAACESIAPVLKPGNVVIIESTCPIGTTDEMATLIAKLRPDLRIPQSSDTGRDIRVAYCPERVLPGNIVHELVNNDRVIGGITPACAAAARALYEIFVQGVCIETDARTAEMCKLAENSYRDLNIAFANELSIICDRLGIDVWRMIELANRHPRVNILQPGPGVGGHCIAVDPWFIVASAPEQAQLIRTARIVNDEKPNWVLAKIEAALSALNRTPITIACLGLAFKANTDDLRESPAVHIVKELARDSRLRVVAVEPNIERLPAELKGVRLVDVDSALKAADLIVILVDHAPFKRLDWREQIARKLVIDTRGLTSGLSRTHMEIFAPDTAAAAQAGKKSRDLAR